MLVEADDLLVPLVIVQGCDTNEPGALMIIQYSFPKSHALVEQLLAAASGSPTGLPLVDDREVAGEWTFADTNTLQWAHAATGATAVTAVMRSAELSLEADHTFTSAVTGGAGRAGQMKFASEREAGTWKVEHDVLVLTTEASTRKYLIAGATRGPDGHAMLVLQPEPWSLGPNAEFELYVAK
ncbi:MAG: hypothetical protein MUC96_35765 [Myxococcaceae bacterium]|nr:hypothetical protein [Myxococcaceae bacterium]